MQVGLPAKCSLELSEPNTKKQQLDSSLYNSPVQTHIKKKTVQRDLRVLRAYRLTERSILISMLSQGSATRDLSLFSVTTWEIT